MTKKEFDKLSKALNYMATSTMESKGPEYTQENKDVLANFKNTGDRLNMSPIKIWGAYFDKQVSSIYAHANNANLKKGNVWVSAKAGFGEKKNVVVRTPTAVAAIRGTKYRVEAGEEESSVLVYQGEVEVNRPENLQKMRRDALEKKQQQGGPPKFRLGPAQEIEAPTQVAGPYEVSLEDWISLVEGMQINLRADGKYHMFEFDKEADAQSDWVRWNEELDTE